MGEKVCVVGLGYVGLPLAIELAKHKTVIGFEINQKKVAELQKGIDPTHEVGNEVVQKTSVEFTSNPEKIKECDYVIISVPTPIDSNNVPDLTYVQSASQIVGKNLKKGAVVIYESTVYPGCTEEECLPILEQESKLSLAKGEFGLGYSPERINPGDTVHRVDTIVKVVSGNTPQVCEKVAELYTTIVKAGVHKAPSIKVAEAAKVIENVQRDLNIALMNELSIIFEKLDINTYDVIDAAATKWNFHRYTPGLVGGHCIGVDPYYLTFKAQQFGYNPKIILAGREINDGMHVHAVKRIENKIGELRSKRILIIGLTFKENVPDYRNSRTKHLIEVLRGKGAQVSGFDPYLSAEIIEDEFHCTVASKITEDYDFYVLASPHSSILAKIPKDKPLLDIKKALKRNDENYITL